MITQVEPEAPKTKEYLQYIFSEILKHEPLHRGKLIEVPIEEGVTSFPEISEITEHSFGSKNDGAEILDEKKRLDSRIGAVIFYTTMAMGKYCRPDLHQSEDYPSARITLRFIILDPEKIRSSAAGPADTIFLNSVGDLWRDPKSMFCYQIREKSNRHKIVRFLAENDGYQQTSDIAYGLGEIDNGTVRGEIGKINSNARKYLKLADDNFIESKKGSGYRINPKYKITLAHL